MATKSTATASTGGGHWSSALIKLKDDPSTHLYSNDTCIILADGYPKGQYHYLVLPREYIANLNSLTAKHVPLLNDMLTAAKVYLSQCHGPDYSDTIKFRFGFHAVPSMQHLHMHIISQDLDSPCIKNKKHWNSFTTDFFLDTHKVITILKEKGRVGIDKEYYEDLLKKPLQCHICHREQRNLPTLKRHIKTHLTT